MRRASPDSSSPSRRNSGSARISRYPRRKAPADELQDRKAPARESLGCGRSRRDAFADWARRNGKFSTDTSLLQVGDVVFYAQHVGVVIQVQPNGTVVTADGDFGGTGKPQAAFASTSHVKIDSFNPRYGQGAADPITGIGLIG
jgi:hypothetical protein